MPQLIIQRNGVFHNDYVFSGVDYLLIGRAPTSDIRLPDPTRRVSRYHAAIVRATNGAERYFLRDLGSLRSTQVFGQAVSQHVLRDGDVIEIGDYELIYSAREHPVAESSPFRIVAKRSEGQSPELGTLLFTAMGICQDLQLTDSQRELIESVIQAGREGADAHEIFGQMMNPIRTAVEARRGFAAIFRPAPELKLDVVGRAGMEVRDQIELTDPDCMDRVRRGKAVLDGHAVMAPILKHEATIGFVCLERLSSTSPFSAQDAEFLTMLGQLAARPRAEAVRHSKERVAKAALDWPCGMVGRSEAMRELGRQIQEAASDEMNVLILGESGTGKELVARAIHAAGKQQRGPFVAKNCAAITESLAESEIFGHAPRSGIAGADPGGAPGWFELAAGGSLFLDEIQGLTISLQDKFLRVLQDKEVWRVRARSAVPVKVKVIAATDHDLGHAIEAGTFRKPFYFRFGKTLRLPPLRERSEDIPLLTFFFIDRYAQKMNSTIRTVSHRAMLCLQSYDWPGNVRELENCIQRALAKVKDRDVLFSWDFPEELVRGQVATVPQSGAVNGKPDNGADPTAQRSPLRPKAMAEVEKEKILEALESTSGNITRAARFLGFRSRQTMLNKMDRYEIPRKYGAVQETEEA